jgi:hypothetical protein
MDVVTATIIGGLGGGLVGALTAYFGAYRLTQKQARIVAGVKLRSAFLPELHALAPKTKITDADVSDLLKAAFEKHSIAIAEFRPFVSKRQVKSFDAAWHNYYGYKGDKENYYLDQYSPFCEESFTESSCQTQADRNRLAHERIKAILAFTEL